jgi:hypothetical protein
MTSGSDVALGMSAIKRARTGDEMVCRSGRHKLVAAWNGSLAAVVGIGWRALALLAAIRRSLIELSAGEAVEGAHEQEDC